MFELKEYSASLVHKEGHPHLKDVYKCWQTTDNQYDILMDQSKGWDHLRICRIDKKPIHNWADMQRIKTLVFGKDALAIEIYPKDEDLIDGSNTYHLWARSHMKRIFIEEFPNLKKMYVYNDKKEKKEIHQHVVIKGPHSLLMAMRGEIVKRNFKIKGCPVINSNIPISLVVDLIEKSYWIHEDLRDTYPLAPMYNVLPDHWNKTIKLLGKVKSNDRTITSEYKDGSFIDSIEEWHKSFDKELREKLSFKYPWEIVIDETKNDPIGSLCVDLRKKRNQPFNEGEIRYYGKKLSDEIFSELKKRAQVSVKPQKESYLITAYQLLEDSTNPYSIYRLNKEGKYVNDAHFTMIHEGENLKPNGIQEDGYGVRIYSIKTSEGEEIKLGDSARDISPPIKKINIENGLIVLEYEIKG